MQLPTNPIHIQHFHLTLAHGLPPERTAMSQFRGIVQADGERHPLPSPPSPASFDALAERIVSQVLARLDQHATAAIPPPPLADTRITHPGVSHDSTPPPKPQNTATLQDLYNDLFQRTKDDKTAQSWSTHRTLLRNWRKHFQDTPGPAVVNITPDTLSEFFKATTDWQTRRSWEKYRQALFQILSAGCPITLDNPIGCPAPDAILTRDTLPAWRLPTPRWFRDRTKTPTTRGGHRKRKLPLLTIDEFGKVLDACDSATFLNPLWWKTWLSLLWFNGPRFRDSLTHQYDTGERHFDLQLQIIDFTESKCGRDSAVPMPAFLIELLTKLRSHQPDTRGAYALVDAPGTRRDYRTHTPEFLLPRGDLSNPGRRLTPQWDSIFETAGIPMRTRHEMRGVAISNWFKHAPTYRFAAIGHKPPKADTQARNYVILDDEFRTAAETYPYPRRP